MVLGKFDEKYSTESMAQLKKTDSYVKGSQRHGGAVVSRLSPSIETSAHPAAFGSVPLNQYNDRYETLTNS